MRRLLNSCVWSGVNRWESKDGKKITKAEKNLSESDFENVRSAHRRLFTDYIPYLNENYLNQFLFIMNCYWIITLWMFPTPDYLREFY